MAHYRLSTDVFSPLHSDISLNDISAFSFGNLSGTPDSDKDIHSPICKNSEKLFDTHLLCSSAKKESAEKFEMVTNEMKKQINQNKSIKKEERFSESYKMLKQSMDDLFNAKSSNTDRTCTSKNVELENCNLLKKTDPQTSANKEFEDIPAVKIHSDSLFSCTEDKSCTSNKISKSKKENTSSKTEKSSKLIKSNKSQGSGDRKNKDCVNSKTEIKDVNTDCDRLKSKRSSKSKTSSKQTSKSSNTDTSGNKKSDEKNERKEASNVKDFKFKSQRKIPVSDGVSTSEQKAISLEKSIQIAIGMEMDSLRVFLLDLNWSMRKELFKVQEMEKKQAEATSYLFTVIDDLLDENKKLISKCSSYKTL